MNTNRIKNYYNNSPMTVTFLGIMIAYFIMITIGGGTTDSQTLVRFGALFPPFIKEYHQYYRFVTAIFIHIGIAHIAFNGYALYIFGTQVERLMGSFKYVLFFLLTGIGGNIITYIFAFDSISAGASGSLFGIFGAFLYLIQYHKEMISPEGRRSILSLLGINLVFTLLVPNISITAHFGGLIIGYLISYIFIK